MRSVRFCDVSRWYRAERCQVELTLQGVKRGSSGGKFRGWAGEAGAGRERGRVDRLKAGLRSFGRRE
jgi:hypothetical protein